jgi:multidrug efflux system membrane fusion protein
MIGSRSPSHPRLAGLALALALSATACGGQRPGGHQRVPVMVATVVRQPVPVSVSVNGTVEPLQTVAVLPQVSGTVERVAFREGDEVRTGQVLFQIDPRPYQAALAGAEADLHRDLAQARSALENARRYDALLQKEYVTAQQAEDQRATADALVATVQADSAAVANARLNLGYATVRAPITGRTGRLLVHEGNVVRSSASNPLVVINRIRPILVRFAVPERILPQIQRYGGDRLPVLARPSDTDTTATGTLTFIDNAVDTSTGTVLLKAEFPNRDGILWPGAFVNATLVLSVDSTALVIPAQAVMTGQSGTYVFRVETDSTVSVRAVTVERTVGAVAVIESGLAPGDRVVTDGQLRLTAGSPVEITRPLAPAGGKADQ